MAQGQADVPDAIAWAYPAAKEKMPFPKLPETAEYRVKGSPLVFTGEQLNKAEDPIDWLPDEHKTMPSIVAHGDHARKIEPCGGCHAPNGQGFLEIPNIGGLPAGYIAEQLNEFAAGRRHSSVPARPPAAYMAGIAPKLTEAEIAEVASYFSSVTRKRPIVRVVESDKVPATRPHFEGWLELAAGGGTEPIGRRIVEVAEDFDRMWAGDPFVLTVAYAPPGSIARGKALTHEGAQPCASCHGANFKGMGKAPPLAGRDPHYLARALWDIKSGARSGPAVALMQAPAGRLDADQIVDVVAYLASLEP